MRGHKTMRKFLAITLLFLASPLFAQTPPTGFPGYVNSGVSNGTAPSCTVAVTGATVGDAILVDTFVSNSTAITSVKDQAGNVLKILLGPTTWSTNRFVETLYLGTATAGGTITITSTLATSVYNECYVYDYKPMQVDVVAQPVTGTAALKGTNSVTTTAAGDLLFAYFHSDGGAVNTAGPGFTPRPSPGANAEDMLVTAPAPYSASMTFAPATNYVGFLVAFKFAVPPPPSISIGTIQVIVGGTPPHTVSLSWNESSSNVQGYNVYRSTTSGPPYTKLNGASLVTPLSYTDGTVGAGNTYYYVVTAVNANGESGYSQQVVAQIPSP